MNVCIIPARGGSKRIPNKNILDFCGKPMIAYSIEAAGASGVFDRIIVSTDSEKIGSVAKEWGAEVLVRPPEMADDYTTAETVFNHIVDQLKKENDDLEYACLLFATAPFVQPGILQQGLEKLKETGATTCFPVAAFPYPIQRALRISEAGALEMFQPENREARTQDLPEAFYDAGKFYWANIEAYQGVMYCSDAVPVILPHHLVHDIDTPEDWKRAELIFRTLDTI